MAKKRKKHGTLTDFWLKIQKVSSSITDHKISPPLLEEIESLNREINNSELAPLIENNFIKPYLQSNSDIKLHFSLTDSSGKQTTITLSEDGKYFYVNPIEIYKLYLNIEKSARATASNEMPYEYQRAIMFHKELIKLPQPYFIFIAILEKISTLCQVFTAEKRGGKKILPDKISMESYFPLLWALKQFETFYKKIQNRDMRSDFGIIWHEGEWVEKK